jgi:hypothetical protein
MVSIEVFVENVRFIVERTDVCVEVCVFNDSGRNTGDLRERLSKAFSNTLTFDVHDCDVTHEAANDLCDAMDVSVNDVENVSVVSCELFAC